MDRKTQLANVAFGGDWAEQIEPREAVASALHTLQRGGAAATDRDPRSPAVLVAVDFLCGRIARGHLMAQSWRAAADLADQGQRQKALEAVLRTISCGLGAAKQDRR
ncbi:hypothetical protein RNZ50_00645 [Paracoccaceae bacterium Fryx2]|nr:hypothetical protein [Paracoccaceae bacterium Fryx2]